MNLRNNGISLHQIKEIVKQLFDEAMEENAYTDVTLNFKFQPIQAIAFVTFNGDINDLKINMNTLKLLFNNDSSEKKLFNVYNNFFHEFEHIKVIKNATNQDCCNYNYLFSVLEYIDNMKSARLTPNFNNLNCLKLFLLNQLMRKNYSISTNEINSNLVGYSKALQSLESNLMEQDVVLYKKIIESLKFLDENIEIKYVENGSYADKFSTVISNSQEYLFQNIQLLQAYPILKIIFEDNGNVKNIYSLYQERTEKNKTMYDKLIINLLLTYNFDLSSYFEDIEFKKYVERISDQYNNSCINYFKNINLGKIFVTDEKILVENLKRKKQKILLLKKLGSKYELNTNSGILLNRTF